MKNISKNLQNQMEKKRKELEDAISNNLPYSDILVKSQELDVIIAEYMNAAENNPREKIITLIKEDLKKIFKITNLKELEHASNNLFTLCYLKVNNVPEQEIANQMMNGDRIFHKEMEGQDLTMDSSGVSLDEYSKLVDKYIKIMKERM